jgi:hypothetical protein
LPEIIDEHEDDVRFPFLGKGGDGEQQEKGEEAHRGERSGYAAAAAI